MSSTFSSTTTTSSGVYSQGQAVGVTKAPKATVGHKSGGCCTRRSETAEAFSREAAKIDQEKKDLDAEMAKLQKERSQLDKRQGQLIGEVVKRSDDLGEEADAAHIAEIEAKEKLEAERQRELQTAKNEREVLSAVVEKHQETYALKDAKIKELQERNEKLIEEKSHCIEMCQKEVQLVKISIDQEVQRNVAAQLEPIQNALAALNKQKSDLESKLTANTDFIKRKNADMDALKQQVQEKQNLLTAQTQEMAKKDAEIVRLTGLLRTSETEVSNLIVKINNLSQPQKLTTTTVVDPVAGAVASTTTSTPVPPTDTR